MSNTVLYGIKNCDSVKKARNWLDAHGVNYRYHDIRSDGLTPKTVNTWLDAVPLDNLINKRGTSWRALDSDTQNSLSRQTAPLLILSTPTLIKRPVLQHGDNYYVGFDESLYETLFS